MPLPTEPCSGALMLSSACNHESTDDVAMQKPKNPPASHPMVRVFCDNASSRGLQPINLQHFRLRSLRFVHLNICVKSTVGLEAARAFLDE